MTQRNIDKGLNIIISTIVSVSMVFLTVNLSGKTIDEKDLKKKIDGKADKIYVDDQNKAQDIALDKRLSERDKINTIILEELGYIKRRVDRIPTK